MTTRSHLRLVATVPPPRPRRLEVMVSVRDGLDPYGRSRIFRLHDRDLDELLAHASHLEARRPQGGAA